MRSPSLTVDIAILDDDRIVLIRRKNDPFKGFYALPGGFVEYGERVEDAALREAREETGLDVELLGIVGVYSDPGRDPRGHVVSICFAARKTGGELRGGSDASHAQWFRLDELPKLAFDHEKILEDVKKFKLGQKHPKLG